MFLRLLVVPCQSFGNDGIKIVVGQPQEPEEMIISTVDGVGPGTNPGEEKGHDFFWKDVRDPRFIVDV